MDSTMELQLPSTSTTPQKYMQHEIQHYITPRPLAWSRRPLFFVLKLSIQDFRVSIYGDPPQRFQYENPPVIFDRIFTLEHNDIVDIQEGGCTWRSQAGTFLSSLGLELEFHDDIIQAILKRVDEIIADMDDPIPEVKVTINVAVRRFKENQVNNPLELLNLFARLGVRRHNLEKVLIHDHQGKICAICLGDYNNAQKDDKKNCAVKLLPCNHVFHEGCIVTWLKKSDLCPYCRSSCLKS